MELSPRRPTDTPEAEAPLEDPAPAEPAPAAAAPPEDKARAEPPPCRMADTPAAAAPPVDRATVDPPRRGLADLPEHLRCVDPKLFHAAHCTHCVADLSAPIWSTGDHLCQDCLAVGGVRLALAHPGLFEGTDYQYHARLVDRYAMAMAVARARYPHLSEVFCEFDTMVAENVHRVLPGLGIEDAEICTTYCQVARLHGESLEVLEAMDVAETGEEEPGNQLDACGGGGATF